MKTKHTFDPFESKLKEILTEKIPESEIVDQKMNDAYQNIRENKTTPKRKAPIVIKFGAAAAILMLAMIYCVKNPAFAAQLPLIGNIFRNLEGQVSYPGDYSKNSIILPVAANEKEGDSELFPADSANNSAASSQTDNGSTASFQAKSGGITVTLSEVSYDYNGIYLALLVQNEEGFASDARLPGQLDFDCQLKLYQADGSTKEFSDANGISMLGSLAEGEFPDPYTFQGIAHFSADGLDLSEYTACELTFLEFRQERTTGRLKTVLVPDYGETSMMEYDWSHYPGTWNFQLDLSGFAAKKQEAAVNDVNAQGFGIEKVIKTEYEMYAVPILPEGEAWYDYMITIWDANGELLDSHGSNFRSMSIYGRDVSEVTVYLSC